MFTTTPRLYPLTATAHAGRQIQLHSDALGPGQQLGRDVAAHVCLTQHPRSQDALVDVLRLVDFPPDQTIDDLLPGQEPHVRARVQAAQLVEDLRRLIGLKQIDRHQSDMHSQFAVEPLRLVESP